MSAAIGLFIKDRDPRKKKERLVKTLSHKTTIGKSASADVKIDDLRCSDLHALIEVKRGDEGFVLIDLGSYYGTFRKNRKVEEEKLKLGDSFQIGSHEFLIKPITEAHTPEEASEVSNIRKVVLQPESAQTQVQLLTDKRLLQVMMFWGQKLLDVRAFFEGSKITVGPQKEATFALPLAKAKTQTAPFLIGSYEEGGLTLNLPVDVHGLIWIGNETFAVDTLRHKDHQNSEFGDLQVKLRVGDRAHLEIGELSLDFQFVTPPEKLPFWSLKRIDPVLKKTVLGITAFWLLLLFLLNVVSFEEKEKTLEDVPEHLKKVLFDAGIAEAIKKQQAAIGQIASTIEGGRARSEEGKSSARKEPEVNQTEKKQTQQQVVTQNADTAAEKVDIDSAFSSQTDVKVQADAVVGPKTAGNTASALAQGNFARGTSGFGAGGGGQSVGIGALKGMGTGGGMGAGNYGLSPSKGREINTREDEEVVILGGLDPDVISAVIKRYLPQIRHCYEQQLTNNPQLKGKVKVSFIIGPSGGVTKASVIDSSMNHSPTESCIIQKVLSWQFPKPKGGGSVGVKYPFLLMSNAGGE